MRTIVFRGKRVDNGEWAYGYLIAPKLNPKKTYIGCLLTDSKQSVDIVEVEPKTVGQYIGLNDKDHYQIYEGDIFEFDDEIWSSCYTSCGTEYDSFVTKNYGVVGYDKEYGRFDFIKYKFNENSVEADLHENHKLDFAEFVTKLEIVGDIYDNPELLEVKE